MFGITLKEGKDIIFINFSAAFFPPPHSDLPFGLRLSSPQEVFYNQSPFRRLFNFTQDQEAKNTVAPERHILFHLSIYFRKQYTKQRRGHLYWSAVPL